MEASLVQVIKAGERARAVDVLGDAFHADPMLRWLYPDEAGYLAHASTFMVAYAGQAFELGTAWRLGDFDAVALWLPPGVLGSEAANDVVLETTTPDVAADALAVFGQLDGDIPAFDHWYLAWLGVPSARSGRGLGSALIRACLETVDAAHMPATLDTPNARTLPLYERHGFAPTGQRQVGSSPTIHQLERSAR